jgi:hypothetical protein
MALSLPKLGAASSEMVAARRIPGMWDAGPHDHSEARITVQPNSKEPIFGEHMSRQQWREEIERIANLD